MNDPPGAAVAAGVDGSHSALAAARWAAAEASRRGAVLHLVVAVAWMDGAAGVDASPRRRAGRGRPVAGRPDPERLAVEPAREMTSRAARCQRQSR